MLPVFSSNFVEFAEFHSHAAALDSCAPGAARHRLSPLTRVRLNNNATQTLDMLGCKSLLHKLCWLFPLAPGALELLQMQCSRGCKRVFAAWERTLAYAEEERRPLHVSEFMPALQPHAPHLRLVLQITGTLMHGVRVLYVQNRHEDRETVVVVDANYVSFLAHDGQQELLFSTECASFMRMLDELFKQELDFQKSRQMHPAQDFCAPTPAEKPTCLPTTCWRSLCTTCARWRKWASPTSLMRRTTTTIPRTPRSTTSCVCLTASCST